MPGTGLDDDFGLFRGVELEPIRDEVLKELPRAHRVALEGEPGIRARAHSPGFHLQAEGVGYLLDDGVSRNGRAPFRADPRLGRSQDRPAAHPALLETVGASLSDSQLPVEYSTLRRGCRCRFS